MTAPSTYLPMAPPRGETLAPAIPAVSRRLLLLTPRPAEAPRVASMLHAGGAGRFECEAVRHTHAALRRLRCESFDAVLVNGDALKGNVLVELERLCDFAGAVPVLLVATARFNLPPGEAIRYGVQEVLRQDELSPERLAVAVACAMERQRRFAALRDLSLTDPLTGLHNRRGFRSLANAHLKLLRRTQRQSLLLFADVDGLKWINDTHGHAAGDQALRLCARGLMGSLRESDVISRYGGDEFAALALDVCQGASLVLLPRIAEAVAELARASRLPFAPSMSIGTAEFGRGALSLDEALARADRMLYAGKRPARGRGRATSTGRS